VNHERAAAALDAADPLAAYRERFVGTDTDLVYFDGNSLGRPLKASAETLAGFVGGEWGDRLIRGWDEGWMDLPLTVGDDLGRVVLGAAPGQVTIGDSTTVLLYKAMRAAVAARPDRTEIVLDRDNFPTDRYVAAGIAKECGLTLRWIDVDPAGGVTVDQVAEVVGERTALVVLSHVAYRSAWIADGPAITALVHEAGALVLWDLSHSGGSVPLALDDWGADLAVGCTYKYLNGGPGSPAFAYVAARHLPVLDQPIPGWIGHADPFSMSEVHEPAAGVRRVLSGTPPVLGLHALSIALERFDGVAATELRRHSLALTDRCIERADALGLEVVTPRGHDDRGSQVSIRHPEAWAVVQALIDLGVVGDHRPPDLIRFGFPPLYLRLEEVDEAMTRLAEVLQSGAWKRWRGAERPTVL